MRIKLDESIGHATPRHATARRLRDDGHDVDTVRNENLAGAADDEVYAAAQSDRRALVTLDLDFANPLRFPPSAATGIIVLRIGEQQMQTNLDRCLDRLLLLLSDRAPEGRLWVVEPDRIREYKPPED